MTSIRVRDISNVEISSSFRRRTMDRNAIGMQPLVPRFRCIDRRSREADVVLAPTCKPAYSPHRHALSTEDSSSRSTARLHRRHVLRARGDGPAEKASPAFPSRGAPEVVGHEQAPR